jgi:peptide/nickel transport system substrate-binding protein
LGWTAATFAALALLAACSGGGDGDGAEDGPAEVEEEPTAVEPGYGGTLTYGLEAETPGGWCLPEAQLAISGIQVARAVYDTLTVPDGEGGYVPFLAESVTSNEAATEWTITLREGVTFHDGTPLDATVVKNNLDAYRGAYPSRNPLLLRVALQPVSTVEVVDDLTVEVTTDVGWPAFPAALFAEGRAGIMAQSQLDDPETCGTRLIGTGPFALERWTVDEALVVTRNPAYWGTDAGGNQLPYLDGIEFRPVADPAARAEAVIDGELDLAHGSGAAELSLWQQEAEAGDVALVSTSDFAEVAHTMLNASAPPFDNLDARLAAAHALDRDELNEVRNLGLFETASGPFSPGTPGHLEDTGFPGHDPDLAEEYAAAYEADTGQPLTFTHTHQDDPEATRTAELLQEQWAEAGIEVDLVPIAQSELITTAISGNFQSIGWRNHPGGDPDTQYVFWYEGSPLNFGRIADPEISALLDEGRSELDRARRAEIYEELNLEFAAEAYDLWLNWVEWGVAGDPDIQGIRGPQLPDGSEPFPGLATGHPVSGMWIDR